MLIIKAITLAPSTTNNLIKLNLQKQEILQALQDSKVNRCLKEIFLLQWHSTRIMELLTESQWEAAGTTFKVMEHQAHSCKLQREEPVEEAFVDFQLHILHRKCSREWILMMIRAWCLIIHMGSPRRLKEIKYRLSWWLRPGSGRKNNLIDCLTFTKVTGNMMNITIKTQKW